MYTVLKWHSALWRQPRGWCGPWWKWVWHPCLKETHLQWCSNNFTAENKKRHFLFCFKDPLCHDDVHSQWTSRLSTDGKNISTMLFLSSFFLSLPEDMLIDSKERGREGERCERETAWPGQGPNAQPRHVPDREWNPQPFGLWMTLNQLSHASQGSPMHKFISCSPILSK